MIRYRLGHLDCVVRFEVDAYFEDCSESSALQFMDNITTSMAQLGVNEPQPSTSRRGSTHVIPKGTFIDPSKLAETKARKAERTMEAMPQLWFGRTPYLLVGKHVEGVVHSTSCSHVQPQFAQWETTNQEKLCKLVSLLAELKRCVCETGTGAAVLVCEPKGAPLRIFTAKNRKSVLPKDIVGRHWSV